MTTKAHSAFIVPKGNGLPDRLFVDLSAHTHFIPTANFERAYKERLGSQIPYEEDTCYLYRGGLLKYSPLGSRYIKVSHSTEAGLAKIIKNVKAIGLKEPDTPEPVETLPKGYL